MKVLNFIWEYLVLIVKALGKFLKWIFAPEVTIGVLAVLIYLHGHHFWAFVLIAWGILLTINEYKQSKS
jgi:hypothetical protein